MGPGLRGVRTALGEAGAAGSRAEQAPRRRGPRGTQPRAEAQLRGPSVAPRRWGGQGVSQRIAALEPAAGGCGPGGEAAPGRIVGGVPPPGGEAAATAGGSAVRTRPPPSPLASPTACGLVAYALLPDAAREQLEVEALVADAQVEVDDGQHGRLSGSVISDESV